MFRDRSSLEHIVVVEGDRPSGLVTRQDLSAKLAGRYAYAGREWVVGPTCTHLPQIARYGSFSRRISAMHPGMPQVRLPGGRQLVRAVGTLLGWGLVSMGPMHEFSQG